MGGFTDIEHLRRAQMAERFVDDDGPELAGYLIGSMSKPDAMATIGALRQARDRLLALSGGCDLAARHIATALDRG